MENATAAAQPATARTETKTENPLSLTASAVQAIKEAMTQQKLDKLRVGVIPGGCSGFSYDLELVSEARSGDLAFEQDGVKIVVDPMSAQYLKGVSIDFVTGLQGSGFKFNNPNARHTCGCGSSFSS